MANTRTDRKVRVLGDTEQVRFSVKEGAPLISDLREGVPVFRRVLGKIIQYILHNNKLYSVSSGESANSESEEGSTLGGPSIGDALVADPLGKNFTLQPARGKDTIWISPKEYSDKAENVSVLRLTAQQDSAYTDPVENKYFVLNELQLKQVDDASWNGGSYFIYAHTDDDSGVSADTTSKFTVDDTGALVAASTLSCSEITSGAVIWQYFPFHILSGTNGRYYYVDNDGYSDSARKWDSYDTAPTGFNYRSVTGNFVVPEDCKLVAMHGVIANQGSTNNPTVTIYHGSITEGTGDTTLASAGAVTVSVSTMRVPYKFSKEDFSVDLAAGDIVVPTIFHNDTGGTRTFTGSLTLKFITR